MRRTFSSAEEAQRFLWHSADELYERPDVDSIFVVGGTTSGCIRATALDSFSYNFKTTIVEQCVFDRFESSHAMNLFDLNTKVR